MKYVLTAFGVLFSGMTVVMAQVNIGIGIGVPLPGVSIGINLPMYPQLIRMPGYPVYYAPQLNHNLFFYDGLYWVFQQDIWYASSWYNGPWEMVNRQSVPLFVLRIPVRYYSAPPSYFRGWSSDAPPRWGERWGPAWEQQRRGWNDWDRRAVLEPAPLPLYQRQYSGERYPPVQQQQQIQRENYRYQPREVQIQPRPDRVSPAQTAPAPVIRQQTVPLAPRMEPRQSADEVSPRSSPAIQTAPLPNSPKVTEQGQQGRSREPERESQMPRSAQERTPTGKVSPEEEKRGQSQRSNTTEK